MNLRFLFIVLLFFGCAGLGDKREEDQKIIIFDNITTNTYYPKIDTNQNYTNCTSDITETFYTMDNQTKKIIENYTVCITNGNEIVTLNATYEETVPIEYKKQASKSANTSAEINKFKEWAKNRNIQLVGVNKSTDYFYYNGSKPEDFLSVGDVPNIPEVANGLYKIPDDLLRAMNNKTFYLSHKNGRGYAVLSSWPNVLTGMNRGSILEQPLNEQQTVHEFAHILDYHGIRGIYEDKENHWKYLDEKRAEIFKVTFDYDPNLIAPPPGYVDVYSTANDAENFAQHFAYYVLNGKEFREKAQNDTLLKKKYDFFKELFKGKEY